MGSANSLMTAIERAKGRLEEIGKNEEEALAAIAQPGPRYRKGAKSIKDGEKELGKLRTLADKIRDRLEAGLDKLQEDYIWN